jgi:hypothetical protein
MVLKLHYPYHGSTKLKEEPDMSVIEAAKKKPLNTEELLHRIEEAKQSRQGRTKTRSGSKAVIIPMIALSVLMIMGLGGFTYTLKAEITGLKTEITDLKAFRSQITVVDPKLKIALLEAKFEDVDKDRDGLRNEIVKVREDMETLRSSIPPAKKSKR